MFWIVRDYDYLLFFEKKCVYFKIILGKLVFEGLSYMCFKEKLVIIGWGLYDYYRLGVSRGKISILIEFIIWEMGLDV